MTYIPGTGEIKIPKANVISTKRENSELVSVVNVTELKNKDTEFEAPDPDVWYLQLKYWLLTGSLFSFFFILLAVKSNYLYLILTPLGPYAAYLSWHIRKKLKKHLKNFDAFS